MLVLYGWFCGALLSISSISLVITQRSFRVPLGVLLHGPNLRFALMLGTLLSAVFALLHLLHLA